DALAEVLLGVRGLPLRRDHEPDRAADGALRGHARGLAFRDQQHRDSAPGEGPRTARAELRETSMAQAHRHFVPAAGADWLLPFYDPFTRLLGTAAAQRALVAQAELAPGQRVLDLGCGTGALSLIAKRAEPGIELVALDPDAKALARARRKAASAGVSIAFEQGFADSLPFRDASFDRVISSFVFHHLESADKPAALRELRRVLRA